MPSSSEPRAGSSVRSAASIAVAAAILVADGANAFFRMGSSPLVTERLDPIISPGSIGLHTHVIHGANAFQSTYTPANQAQSTCTTLEPQADLSPYWYPQLYFQHTNGSFSAIPGYANIYYLQRGMKNETMKAFPEGLKMIAGSPLRRTFDTKNPNDKAVSYVCQDYAGGHDGDPAWAERNDFFSHNCPNSMRAQVMFPSCWTGKAGDLYRADNSHVSYPIGDHEHGYCPKTHPVRFITLFIEAVFDVQNFPYRKDAWTFAFGDKTGLGFHADFIAQWDTKVLQDAIDQCTDPNSGGGVSACPPLMKSANKQRADACKPIRPVVNENVGLTSPIPKLNGDNPVWIGTGSKPSCNCQVPVPGYLTANSTLASGFTTVGCVAEAPNGRLLTGATLNDPKGMTGKTCTDFCASKGFTYAGTEYAQECYCGNSFANGGSGKFIDPFKCSMSCKGRATENCGGSSTITLYKKGAVRVALTRKTKGKH